MIWDIAPLTIIHANLTFCLITAVGPIHNSLALPTLYTIEGMVYIRLKHSNQTRAKKKKKKWVYMHESNFTRKV